MISAGAFTYYTDDTLRELAQGDGAAFTRVYRAHYADLFYLSQRLVGDKAPDVLADVFLQLWSQHKLFETPQHLLAYLRVMTRNRCLDVLKQHERQQKMHSELAFVSEKEYEDRYFAEIIESQLFTLIHHEIDQLPQHLRNVFTMAYIDGMNNAQIASTLGLRDASVRVLKSEALKILRANLYHVELLVILHLLGAAAA